MMPILAQIILIKSMVNTLILLFIILQQQTCYYGLKSLCPMLDIIKLNRRNLKIWGGGTQDFKSNIYHVSNKYIMNLLENLKPL